MKTPEQIAQELIAEARAFVTAHHLTDYPTTASLLERLADALEVAEKRATEAEANRDEFRTAWNTQGFEIIRLEDQLAAALAVIEKARGMFQNDGFHESQLGRLLSSVPADVLRERDDRMRAEGWDECFSTAYDGPFTRDPNNPYRQTEEENR